MINNTADKKRFTVVIPHYKREELCVRCVESVINQSFCKSLYEIILVDDGFTLSKGFIEKYSKQIYILQKSHTGVCATRNLGILRSNAAYIIFIDNDCIAHRMWLTSYEEFIKNNLDAVAIGGQTMSIQSKSLISEYCQFRNFLRWPIMVNGNISSLITANVCYKKQMLEEIGMFDLVFDDFKLGAGGEDADISYRILNAGYKLEYCDSAIVYHLHRTSLSGLVRQQVRNGRGLAIHALIRNRQISELGLPQPSIFNYLIHIYSYIFKDTGEYKCLLNKVSIYWNNKNVIPSRRVLFVFLDFMRRVSLLIGVLLGFHVYNRNKNK